mgnify:CR=1 FL=1
MDSVAIATVVTGDWWVWYRGVGYLLAGWPVLACGVTVTAVETTVRLSHGRGLELMVVGAGLVAVRRVRSECTCMSVVTVWRSRASTCALV